MTEPLNRPSSSGTRITRPPGDQHVAGSRPNSSTGDQMGTQPGRESAPTTPRWVKAFGIVTVVLVLLFAGLHLTGNVPAHTPPSSGTQQGTQAP